jgi:pimeloyl-ACP methyl ester carboxylesterase
MRPAFVLAFAAAVAFAICGGAHAAATPPAAEAAYATVRPMIAEQQRLLGPQAVEVSEAVELGGLKQWITLRGADRSNPVLIYVHGGPGAAEMGRSWPYQRGWEDFFTVVQWDQRGTGKTLRHGGEAANKSALTRQRMADDLVELIALVRQRLGVQRVVLLGHSWGNVIGMDAALRKPEWVSAYVGVGPLLNLQANEHAQYQALLGQARRRGDATALAELEAIAPYPGEGEIPFTKVNVARKWVMAYGGLAAYRSDANFYFRAARLSPYYEFEDRLAIDQGGQLSVPALLPDMRRVDHTRIREVSFPMFMFLGRHDLTTPSPVIEAWMAQLKAPLKRIVWFEHSAHLAPHEEPGRFLVQLVEQVRPLAAERP